MIPYMVGKLAPNSSHLTRGLVKSVPGRGYFRAVPSQNGDKYVTSPPPQSLNLSYKEPEKPPATSAVRIGSPGRTSARTAPPEQKSGEVSL